MFYLFQKRANAQPNKTPCSDKCFLHTVDPEVLSSLMHHKQSSKYSKAKLEKEKAPSKPLNPPPLIYVDSGSEDSSSEEEMEEDLSGQTSETPLSSDDEAFKKPRDTQEVAKKSGVGPLVGMGMSRGSIGMSWKGKGKIKCRDSRESLGREPEEKGDSQGEKMEEVLPQGWNGREVILFRMIHPIFGHNYCSIAEIIHTKTCQQVCE